MRFRITDNHAQFMLAFKKAEQERQEQVYSELEKFVSDSVTIITRNPTRGLDVEGRRFSKNYSTAYKEKRAKAGYQTAPVNLTLTGGMLTALTHSIKKFQSKIVAEIFFTNTATQPPSGFGTKSTSAVEKARGVEAHGYKFFGLSKRRINELFNLFR